MDKAVKRINRSKKKEDAKFFDSEESKKKTGKKRKRTPKKLDGEPKAKRVKSKEESDDTENVDETPKVPEKTKKPAKKRKPAKKKKAAKKKKVAKKKIPEVKIQNHLMSESSFKKLLKDQDFVPDMPHRFEQAAKKRIQKYIEDEVNSKFLQVEDLCVQMNGKGKTFQLENALKAYALKFPESCTSLEI